MGVYKPLSNAFYDDLILRTRGKLGTELVPMKRVSAWMVEETGRAKAATLAVDQRPLDPKKAWWMEWMGQETAMHFGLEAFARKFDMPVVFFGVRKAKGKPRRLLGSALRIDHRCPHRSGPKARCSRRPMTASNPQLREDPAHWLWSHTRWKHSRPKGVPLQRGGSAR